MADAKKEKPLVKAISNHVWNKDLSRIAFAPNNENVEIWETPGRDASKWKQQQVLSEHAGYVSGIDWSPVTNQIVTCGHDRNAYVWAYDEKEKEWRPTLVILRINRAATSVQWSPQGNKFAVTSGAKCVPVCHYEETNHWWISKMIKNHKSTVLTVAWSPNNRFVVTGSTDYKARIFSAFIENLDKQEDDGFGDIFSGQYKFGAQLAEYEHTKAWVNAVAWSPGGKRVAFAGHGSSLHFVQLSSSTTVQTINEKHLPHLDLKFLDENTLVAAGFEMNPAVYVFESDKWKFKEFLDKLEKKKTEQKGGIAGTRTMWQDTASRGQEFGSGEEELILTRHENVITTLQNIGKGEITTTGLDGRLLYWKAK